MNPSKRAVSTVLAALLVFGFALDAEAERKSKQKKSDPEMVIDNDKVKEWRNPKLTELHEVAEWEKVAEAAETKPVIIFKHSTTCPVSGRAAQRMDAFLRESEDELPAFYMLKVQDARPVSNAIEAHYEVKHESPQILLVKDGKTVWHTSHDAITAEAVEEALKGYEMIEPSKETDETESKP